MLSIANAIINDHPLQQKDIRIWKPDPETQATFDSIDPHTEKISFGNLEESDDVFYVNRSGFKITSPVNDNVSITTIITEVVDREEDACPFVHWTTSVAILPSKDLKVSR